MSTIPRYFQGGTGRFDFRVPDGMGNWVYPDWDDPQLKVEFYDSGDTLRFTATVSSSPPLVKYDDYDQGNNLEGGPFVAVDGIDLSAFALGLCEALVYARFSGVQVLPYPTILAAFEVMADVAPGPLYTSVDKVKSQIPGQWPEEVTDDMVTMAIADASRKADAYLGVCYETPFPDLGDDPATPSELESICRKLAAYQCLEWMGRVNASAEEQLMQKGLAQLSRLAPEGGRTPTVRLPGYRGPLAAYQGELGRSDDQVEGDLLA